MCLKRVYRRVGMHVGMRSPGMAYFWAGRGAFGWGEIRSRFQRFFGLATLIPGRCPISVNLI